jgi:ectoine hydroxylase-related dioxygenase (phytanoyl-CoA dioxygenase family)
MMRLTAAQIASFREHGFLALKQLTTSDETMALLGIFNHLLESGAGLNEGAQYDVLSSSEGEGTATLIEIMDPANYAPQLRQTMLRANALAIAKQLLGPKAGLRFEHAIYKPAHFGGATPWHQDDAYHDDPNLDCQQISIWIPLQAVDVENGCMLFLPGSHLGEVRAHRPFNNDPTIHALECSEEVAETEAIACPLPAGGCTIHAGSTLHATGPNTSSMSRWAYIIVLDVPPVPRQSRRRFPWNEGRRTADLVRRRAWLRRGGLVIHWWRVVKAIPETPRRIRYAIRRRWRAVTRLLGAS